jgi:GrpB-like predicted nucleotidyltransferase (UPF0157 family)
VIAVVPYDPHWPEAFQAERSKLAAALGELAIRIEHNGSTAVPGLAAKPIIDIQISVGALHPLTAYASALASCGYVHVPHADDAFAPFFHRPARWPHTHHVHVVQAGSEEEQKTLLFRDYLRAHVDAAREYEALKRQLAADLIGAHEGRREAYADSKTVFVNDIVRRALEKRRDFIG